ncbi:hypothetical protein RchiOBHm_Chr3g0474291 [Rosa chinensis]|uniref:Uncharacterized protein n=1 Tax=Rosa chinensis TaxID=74649 RepID=A0A2P6RC32_ROSCH|nr:hypothetical protein RchiOBHm_Chr3g0474291 [Rosa chinensis]
MGISDAFCYSNDSFFASFCWDGELRLDLDWLHTQLTQCAEG